MNVYSHLPLPRESHEGVRRCCLVGTAQGVRSFEAWHYQLDPGAQTAWPAQGGAAALLLLEGAARLVLDSGPQRVQAPCTVVLPPAQEARLHNVGSAPLCLWLLRAAPGSGPACVPD